MRPIQPVFAGKDHKQTSKPALTPGAALLGGLLTLASPVSAQGDKAQPTSCDFASLLYQDPDLFRKAWANSGKDTPRFVWEGIPYRLDWTPTAQLPRPLGHALSLPGANLKFDKPNQVGLTFSPEEARKDHPLGGLLSRLLAHVKPAQPMINLVFNLGTGKWDGATGTELFERVPLEALGPLACHTLNTLAPADNPDTAGKVTGATYHASRPLGRTVESYARALGNAFGNGLGNSLEEPREATFFWNEQQRAFRARLEPGINNIALAIYPAEADPGWKARLLQKAFFTVDPSLTPPSRPLLTIRLATDRPELRGWSETRPHGLPVEKWVIDGEDIAVVTPKTAVSIANAALDAFDAQEASQKK